ncbi:hypothetical protein [Catenulispora subtropica]|uniref:Uncharacterized protein n=1 Tax=Catenulispora subtropica TaxID=450798 RepID=A0ABP5C368_9ACTN
MTDPVLLVPMAVQAMAINDAARQLNYRRWTYSYEAIEQYDTPEQSPFDVQSGQWSNDASANGVYLMWTLPDALRRGAHDSAAATTHWPLVPNRWLVVRYSGPAGARTAAGWVVESDHLDQDATSRYLDPSASAPVPTAIGRKIDLSTGGWSETGTGKLFLTAVAPGNPAFASFQPNVEDVFSIHDDLSGVAAGTLAYAVAGWYSNPADDALRTAGPNLAAALSALGWTAPGADTLASAVCVVHGLVRGIAWDPHGPAPAGERPTSARNVCVSVADTSVDALTAMVARQAAESGHGGTDLDAKLLKAFQYGLLPTLDQPDGPELLRAQAQQAAFLRSSGGTLWEISDAPPMPPGGSSLRTGPAAQPDESWLVDLNQAQRLFDDAARQLSALQWELYEMAWKRGWANANQMPTGCSDSQFAAALDPAGPDSLLSRTIAQLAKVRTASGAIPHGDTAEQLADAIRAYGTAHQLASGRVLRATVRPSYWQQANPVVVVSGAKASAPLTPAAPLACRLPASLIDAVSFASAPGGRITAAELTVPTVPLTGLPQAVATAVKGLIEEFFLVDPDNAAAVAQQVLHDPEAAGAIAAAMADPAKLCGTPPAIHLGAWSQPWSPLFLIWRISYCPVDFGTAADPNWIFDGNRYRWTGRGAAMDSQKQLSYKTFSGYSLLTPQNVFTMRTRLQQFAKADPHAPLSQVEAFIEQADGWDLLSQTLDGFHQQLALRDPVAVVGPDPMTEVVPGVTLADVVGTAAAYHPMPGAPKLPQFRDPPPSAFQPVRSGLAFISDLIVVDAFGQTLEVVDSSSAATFRPVLAEDLLPDKPAAAYEPNRMLQLRPRLLQPARLRFDFVSALDDSKVLSLHDGVNPVCGWIILNHLDSALAAYSPAGEALGELRLTVDVHDTRIVTWMPAPGGRYPTVAALTSAYPHLGQTLAGMVAAGAQQFPGILETIDESLWSIVPSGLPDDQSTAVLAGRPLALVRARLGLELDGPALTDPTWRFTFQQPPAAVLDLDFPVRIGDTDLRGDGLVGYFTGSDYAHCTVGRLPAAVTGGGFLATAGPGTFPSLRANGADLLLTMLVDPRAPVHVVSDILPVASLGIDASFVDPALAAMTLLFEVSPTLTILDTTGPVPLVRLPVPASRDFTWSWLENDSAGKVKAYPTAAPATGAEMPDTPPSLRSGWLCVTRGQRP